jgi:hypothetical protein
MGIDKLMKKQTLKLMAAHLQCEWYLLTLGMWRGEFKIYSWCMEEKDRIIFIAAATGSIWDKTLKIQKIFYNETDTENSR